MKNVNWRLLFVFSILLELSLPVYSQSKSEISFGLAFPEMSNIKIKYGTDFQVGVGIGFMPVVNFLTLTGDMYYKLPNKSENRNPNTWNINLGGTFLDVMQSWSDEQVLFFYSKLGRRINFKNDTGIHLDIGVGLWLTPSETSSKPLGGSGGLSLPDESSKGLVPVGSISYFINF
jgi:hypothetical protein